MLAACRTVAKIAPSMSYFRKDELLILADLDLEVRMRLELDVSSLFVFRLPRQPHCDPVVLGSSGEVQQRAETAAAAGRKQFFIKTVDSRFQLRYLRYLLLFHSL